MLKSLTGLADGLREQGRQAARSLVLAVVLGSALASLILAGVGFLVAALYQGLAELWGPVGAAVAVGFLLLLLALLLFLTVLLAATRQPAPVPAAPPPSTEAIARDIVFEGVTELLSRYPKGLLLGALAVGMLLGLKGTGRKSI